MKKLLILSIMFAAVAVAVPVAEAKTASSNAVKQGVEYTSQPRRGDWNLKRRRSVTRTRIVRVGFRTYRETYRITYLPNGRTRVRVISRVRIR